VTEVKPGLGLSVDTISCSCGHEKFMLRRSITAVWVLCDKCGEEADIRASVKPVKKNRSRLEKLQDAIEFHKRMIVSYEYYKKESLVRDHRRHLEVAERRLLGAHRRKEKEDARERAFEMLRKHAP
jgi:hypothetical protein